MRYCSGSNQRCKASSLFSAIFRGTWDNVVEDRFIYVNMMIICYRKNSASIVKSPYFMSVL